MKKDLLALLPCLLLCASPALAVDGVLEINQACANGDGCFTGDTTGFPVDITQPGSYALTSDLEVASANVIVIHVLASPVAIDLNGFSIRGITTCSGLPSADTFACTDTGSGSGILVGSGGDSLTVRNGQITGMGGRGVVAGAGSQVEDVHFSHNGGRAVGVGSASIVRGNTIYYNGGTAVGQEFRAGVSAGGASVITDNAMRYLGGTAINGDDDRVAGNVINNVSGDAIVLTTGIAVGNQVSQATALGLRAGSTTGVGGNVFRANNSFGDQFCSGVEISTNVGSRATTCP